jgi:hypothetical protein
VHEDRGRRATSRRLLELVGPASVVSHCAATKQTLVLRDEARVVDEDHRRLAAHVDAGVVVPAELRCGHAVAHEDERARRDRLRLLHSLGPDDHVVAKLQGNDIRTRRETEARIRRGCDLDHGHLLQETRAVCGLEAELAELRFQVRERTGFSDCPGFAPVEIVRRERRHMRAVDRSLDGTGRGGGRDQKTRHECRNQRSQGTLERIHVAHFFGQ